MSSRQEIYDAAVETLLYPSKQGLRHRCEAVGLFFDCVVKNPEDFTDGVNLFFQFYPKFMDRVLGMDGHPPWLTEIGDDDEYKAMLRLLGPKDGLLFSLLYLQSRYRAPRYDVPLSALPAPARAVLAKSRSMQSRPNEAGHPWERSTTSADADCGIRALGPRYSDGGRSLSLDPVSHFMLVFAAYPTTAAPTTSPVASGNDGGGGGTGGGSGGGGGGGEAGKHASSEDSFNNQRRIRGANVYLVLLRDMLKYLVLGHVHGDADVTSWRSSHGLSASSTDGTTGARGGASGMAVSFSELNVGGGGGAGVAHLATDGDPTGVSAAASTSAFMAFVHVATEFWLRQDTAAQLLAYADAQRRESLVRGPQAETLSASYVPSAALPGGAMVSPVTPSPQPVTKLALRSTVVLLNALLSSPFAPVLHNTGPTDYLLCPATPKTLSVPLPATTRVVTSLKSGSETWALTVLAERYTSMRAILGLGLLRLRHCLYPVLRAHLYASLVRQKPDLHALLIRLWTSFTAPWLYLPAMQDPVPPAYKPAVSLRSRRPAARPKPLHFRRTLYDLAVRPFHVEHPAARVLVDVLCFWQWRCWSALPSVSRILDILLGAGTGQNLLGAAESGQHVISMLPTGLRGNRAGSVGGTSVDPQQAMGASALDAAFSMRYVYTAMPPLLDDAPTLYELQAHWTYVWRALAARLEQPCINTLEWRGWILHNFPFYSQVYVDYLAATQQCVSLDEDQVNGAFNVAYVLGTPGVQPLLRRWSRMVDAAVSGVPPRGDGEGTAVWHFEQETLHQQWLELEGTPLAPVPGSGAAGAGQDPATSQWLSPRAPVVIGAGMELYRHVHTANRTLVSGQGAFLMAPNRFTEFLMMDSSELVRRSRRLHHAMHLICHIHGTSHAQANEHVLAMERKKWQRAQYRADGGASVDGSDGRGSGPAARARKPHLVATNLHVPVLGDVWDKPIASYECGLLVRLLYRAHRFLKPRGIRLDPLRWVARWRVMAYTALTFFILWWKFLR